MAYTWPIDTYNKPPASNLYDYSQGMENTPDTAVPLIDVLANPPVNKMSMIPEGLTDYISNLFGRNEGIASPNVVPENMRQYLAGTDWRSQMQPASAFGTTRAAPMTDRIMDDELMWQAQSRAIDAAPFNEPPSMRLEGEPYFAEGWRPGDIFDRDTTIGGYQKFPQGDQWRNKDKYLRSQDYLSTLEPSLAGAKKDRRGFKFPSFLGLGLDALKDKFEYKGAEGPAWDYTGTGGWLTEEEQDQLNARGGYYSEAARKDRFQRQRVVDMMARKAAGKKISDRNFEELIKQGYGPKDGPIIGGDGTTGGQRYEGPPTSDWNPNITGAPTHIGAGPLHGASGGQNRGPTGYTGGNRSPGHPSNRARGGYMRSGYSNGGRVGILAAF